jgi:hypothetical protein
MMIPGTAVFKTRIGNALHVSGGVSLALLIWGTPACFKLRTIFVLAKIFTF